MIKNSRPKQKAEDSVSAASGAMEVFLLPRMDQNPYGNLLADAVARAGARLWPRIEKDILLSAYLRAIWRAGRLPDILHQQWVHHYFIAQNTVRSGFRALCFLIILHVLKGMGVKIVWTLHNRYNHRKRWLRLDRWVRRRMVDISDAVIVHSQSAADEMSAYFSLSDRDRRKLRVVPHAAYVGVYRASKDADTMRVGLGIGSDDLCIGLIGSLYSYKGPEDLMEAFRKLNRPDCHLLMVGEPESPVLEESITGGVEGNPRIHLRLAWLPDEEMANYFQAVDVVVLPFRSELTSGSVLLALSFGKAIVIPRIKSILEGLPPDGYITYEQGDPAGLITALKSLNKAQARRMGAVNGCFAEGKDMTWERMGERTFSVYNSVWNPERTGCHGHCI